MLGPDLARLVTDEYAQRAGAAYARSLVTGAEVSEGEWALARELEAVLEAMYLMASSDGELASDELMLLSSSMQAIVESSAKGVLSRAELALPALRLTETLGRFARSLSTEGLDTRISAVARRLKNDAAKRLAFRLAGGVAFVDDVVRPDEVAALDILGAALGFSSSEQLALLKEVHAALR
jgi:tellurite resistance protein